MRNLVRRLALLMLVLLLAPLTVLAAPDGGGGAQGITMQAEAGFDGKAKMGAWVPVAVTVTNEGAEFEGAVGFEVASSLGPGVHTGVYRYPLVVPAGATKRLQVLVPYDPSRQMEIALWKGQERVAVATPPLEITRDLLVGVLGVEPADLPFLAGRQAGDRAVRLIRLDPATMPTEMRVLENLDAILLDRFTYSELPDPQRQSLEGWVEHGGTLLLAGGPEAKRLEGLAPWAPITLKAVDTVAVAGVGQAALARFDLGEWRITQRAGAEPLAASYKKGMGAIHLLAFDPALQPFATWAGTPDLLMTMLPNTADPFMNMGGKGGMGGAPGGKAAMIMVDALNQFPMREVPSARNLVWLLAGYAVLIGPVHFLLLRGFKKLGWALLTLPILAMAGGAGAWAYTRQAHGVDAMANSISVIEAQPGSSIMKVQSLVGFFMPPASAHKVAMGNALLSPVAVPFMAMTPMAPGGTMAPVRTTFEGVGTAAIGPNDDWNMYALSAEGTLPVAGTVEGSLQIDADRMAGKLTSKLPFKLTGAVVASGTSFQRLGDLNPGDTAEVSLMQSAFTVQYGSDNPLAEVLARANEFRGFTGPTPTAAEYEQMRRSQLSWVTANAISWVRSPNRPSVVVVGWAEYQALPITIDGRKADVTAMALYVQPLSASVSAGDFTLPASWTQPRSVMYNGQVGGMSMMPGWNMAKGDHVVLEFAIDEALRDRVSDVELRMPALARGQNGAYPVSFAFFRWADGAWVDVPEELEGASPTGAPAFISPGGVVRVKVTQMIEERVPLAVPGLTVRGKGVSGQ